MKKIKIRWKVKNIQERDLKPCFGLFEYRLSPNFTQLDQIYSNPFSWLTLFSFFDTFWLGNLFLNRKSTGWGDSTSGLGEIKVGDYKIGSNWIKISDLLDICYFLVHYCSLIDLKTISCFYQFPPLMLPLLFNTLVFPSKQAQSRWPFSHQIFMKKLIYKILGRYKNIIQVLSCWMRAIIKQMWQDEQTIRKPIIYIQ